MFNEEEQKEKSRIALLFIVIDNKVLLFKRSPEETTNPGKYGMLGGHIEKGETPEEALTREIKEEAGVKLSDYKKLKTYELDEVQLNVFYTNEFDVDNIKLDTKEHTGKKFFTLEELDEMSPEECIDTNKGIARDYNKKSKEDKQLNEAIEKIKQMSTLITEAEAKIHCTNCGWLWNKKDGGNDLYMCHKCGHDNKPKLNLRLKK
jgi:8-oxo-dGTP diphosphatase